MPAWRLRLMHATMSDVDCVCYARLRTKQPSSACLDETLRMQAPSLNRRCASCYHTAMCSDASCSPPACCCCRA